MFIAVVQLALALHVRNTLIDAAGEGARWGALVGNTAESGADRTRALVTASLNERFAADVDASVAPSVAGDVMVVEISAPLPVIGLVGPRTLVVQGHARVERP